MRVLWLPAVLKAAGLVVHEVAGWKTRGADTFGPVRGITCHHTAGSKTSTVQGELNTLLHGSSSAPAPIAQLLLARNGDWHVVASGLCHHNKVGWAGPNKGYGNDAILGIEAQHAGAGEAWTDVQYSSYVRGVAALVAHKASGWEVTVGRVAGHKEHQPGAKSDPTFDMTKFRAHVQDQLEGDDMPTAEDFVKELLSTKLGSSGPTVAVALQDSYNGTGVRLLALDQVPNPYVDAATNPRITVAAALKGAATADKVAREVQPEVAALRAEVELLSQKVDQLLGGAPLPGSNLPADAVRLAAAVAKQVVEELSSRLATA